MLRICRCGKDFETKLSQKVYCSSVCQLKFSSIDAWENIKSNYRFRCRALGNMAKNRSKTQNLDFNLTKDYLINLWEEQEGKCALSGRSFKLSRPIGVTVESNAPSLDRINPSLGYVKGNVRFVCYQVNTALNEYGDKALLSLCKDILMYNGIVA